VTYPLDLSNINVKTAIRLAFTKHINQDDKDGLPYVLHLQAVAQSFKSPLMQTAGLLHDIVEDTDVTVEHLTKLFPGPIPILVDAVSRRPDEVYADYITRVIAGGEAAVELKLADVRHNLRADRIHAITPSLIDRLEKTMDRLLDALTDRGTDGPS